MAEHQAHRPVIFQDGAAVIGAQLPKHLPRHVDLIVVIDRVVAS